MFGVTNLPSLTIVKPTNGTIGYLGIGTDDPQEMAHVVGTLLIESTQQTASGLQFRHYISPYQSFSDYWNIFSNQNGLVFNSMPPGSTTGTQRMIISIGGVGIGSGITIPQAKLHVNGNFLAEGDITTLNKLVLAPAANSTSQYWELSRTSAGLNFAYKDQALQNILFIGNNGAVGIGKTNPSVALDVNGAFKATSADIAGTLSVQTLNAQNLAFAGNTIFNGKVGIFTSNPVAILHLHDSEILDPRDDTKDSTDINSRGIHRIFQITTGNSATDGFTIHRDASSPSVLFFKQHDQQSLSIEGPGGGLGIAPNGNIDIGKNLVVAGSFKAQSVTITGALTANSATISGTLTANMLKAPSAKINGLVCANEVRVQLTGVECWPDFVFGKDYKLLPLKDVEQFIMKNQHLPNVPSSAEVEANGVNLGEMQGTLLQKIEEMTLYIIQLEKRLSELESKKGGE